MDAYPNRVHAIIPHTRADHGSEPDVPSPHSTVYPSFPQEILQVFWQLFRHRETTTSEVQ